MKLTQLLACTVLLTSAALAQALDIQPYSAQALARAQQANQPVALHFHADWCPTCRAQDKALQSLKAEEGLNLSLLTVNYDTEKELKRQFKVNAQSTLVVLKGATETTRLVGDTTVNGIRAALKTAL